MGAGKYLLRIPYLVPTQFQESIPPPPPLDTSRNLASRLLSEFIEAERKFTFKYLHKSNPKIVWPFSTHTRSADLIFRTCKIT